MIFYQVIYTSEYWFITNVIEILNTRHGKMLKYEAAIIFNESHLKKISSSQFINLFDYCLHIYKTN